MQELFITICLHFKDCEYKEVKKILSFKRRTLRTCVMKKIWTVKTNWLMLYDVI